jgi:glycosyltransferase involved in cell wall biosynthesis
MPPPRVSVVIPVHNGELYIAAALESIASQGCEGLETIVVDDGSVDRSAEIAWAHGARVIQGPWRGVAAARNRGIATARGELIAFLDADDLWTDGSLELRIAQLDGDPELDFVYGMMRDFSDPDRPPPAWLPRRRNTEAAGLLSAFLLRREACARVGEFDESLLVGEDLDWICRLQDCGNRGAQLDEIVFLQRLHAASTMVRNVDRARDALKVVVRRSIERKRASAR